MEGVARHRPIVLVRPGAEKGKTEAVAKDTRTELTGPVEEAIHAEDHKPIGQLRKRRREEMLPMKQLAFRS